MVDAKEGTQESYSWRGRWDQVRSEIGLEGLGFKSQIQL